MKKLVRSVFIVILFATLICMFGCDSGGGDDESETVPPTVISVSPLSGATEIEVNPTISVTFSEEMDASTITTGTFYVDREHYGNSIISGNVTYSGDTAIFTPTENLLYNTIYVAHVSHVVQDLAGNWMLYDYRWSFTTTSAPDTTPPAVMSVVPDVYSQNIVTNTTVSATFNEAIDTSTVTALTFTLKEASSNNPVAGTVSINGTSQVIFTPSSPLAYETSYRATIAAGVKDLLGNEMASDYRWLFTTKAESFIPAGGVWTGNNGSYTIRFYVSPDGSKITATGSTLGGYSLIAACNAYQTLRGITSDIPIVDGRFTYEDGYYVWMGRIEGHFTSTTQCEGSFSICDVNWTASKE